MTPKSVSTINPPGTTSSMKTAMPNVMKRLMHPRCVWNLLKQHVSRYTPDVVENICGTPKADFLKVCEVVGLYQRAGSHYDLPVCAGLDATYRRGAEHPYYGDDPVAARQYGDGWRAV
ncbi:Formate dehydrogenase major subunit [Salmonella enterica subsp. enterica]|uniref:Formate dehydrogenase major subunit n=1 Tax=Salmonella enterica I TaxID=59201 RepID=A0A447PIW0_SALET|nr:Formate dehydrogenase major subunit [Salmonella enterica subsp. enterica]